MKNSKLLNKLYDLKIELNSKKNEYEKFISNNDDKINKLKKEINELEKELDDIIYCGLYNKDKLINMRNCLYSMPNELVHTINRLFHKIYKSPYSCSIYSGEKDWNYTEPNSYTVSDHFNFFSKGKYHKLTNTPLINEIIKKYNIDNKDIINENDYWYLCKFIVGEKSYSDYLRENSAEKNGAYVILDVFKKDYDKVKKINSIQEMLRIKYLELNNYNIANYEYDIKHLEKIIKIYQWLVDNNYNSEEQFEKYVKNQLKKEYEKIEESLREKLNLGLVKATIEKKDWAKSGKKFKLISINKYTGSIISLSKSTITIKTNDGSIITGRNYDIDTSSLTEKEKLVLFGYGISTNIYKDIIDDEFRIIIYKKMFKF